MTDQRHYSIIEEYNRKLRIFYKGEIIAETVEALILKEVAKTVYDPVFYIPKKDISIELKLEEARSSTCPIKGVATYWNIINNFTKNYFAWSYENPIPRSKKIKSHIAFNNEYISFNSAPL